MLSGSCECKMMKHYEQKKGILSLRWRNDGMPHLNDESLRPGKIQENIGVSLIILGAWIIWKRHKGLLAQP